MTITALKLLAEVPDLPGHEVQRLLLKAVGATPSWLLGDPEVSGRAAQQFFDLVARRRLGEPLQYIEGDVAFGPIELSVDQRALIPRPETERLWELAIGLAPDKTDAIVVDLCTGSGNIALSLKHALPAARVIGTDASPDAVALANQNSTDLALAAEFYEGDLFAALPSELRGSIDMIVSNPPYVATTDLDQLPAEVRDYEPHAALFADIDGLAVLRRIASDVETWLKPGGVLICEIGESQGGACRELFCSLEPEIMPDLVGRDRFVVGRSPMRPDLH